MFTTPPPSNMVLTRGGALREQKARSAVQRSAHKDEELKDIRVSKSVQIGATSPVPGLTHPHVSPPKEKVASSKHKSTSSSIHARKKLLELQAAEQKADIEKKLIDLKLAADIAALHDERSQQSRSSIVSSQTCNSKVNEWLEKSRIENEPVDLLVLPNVSCNLGITCESTYRDIAQPPPAPAAVPRPSSTPKDIIHQEGPSRSSLEEVVTNLKEIVKMESSLKVGNKEILARMATSKDLPLYFGDPMEWLQFREAYNESTELCGYSETENIWRLRKCLRGEAKDSVTALLYGHASSKMVMETLELQFGRPENIIHKVTQLIKKLQPLPHTYHTEIVTFAVKIRNYVAAAASTNSEYLHSPELVTAIISKLPEILIAKWTDYSYDHREECKPKMEQLSEFLYREANKTAMAGVSHIHSQPEAQLKRRNFTQSGSHHAILQTKTIESDETHKICKFCRKSQQHTLPNCVVFKRAMKRDRWRFVKMHQLCFKCLLAKHNRETCPAEPCSTCQEPHHYLLHWSKPNNPTITEPDESGNIVEDTAKETVTNTITTTSPSVLLKTVRVYINGPHGKIPTYALLDDGATVTLLSSDLAERAGLKGLKQTMRIRGAWNTGELLCESEVIDLTLSTESGETFGLKARKMKELDLPTQREINIERFDHLSHLKNCFEYGNREIKPQLLIGQDNYHLLAPKEIIMGQRNEPHATHTSLGWCVHGTVCTSCDVTVKRQDSAATRGTGSTLLFTAASEEISYESADVLLTVNASPHSNHPMHNTCAPENNYTMLHEEVRRYFEFESMGVSLNLRENKEEQKALSILKNTAKFQNGCWEVGLPWKSEDAKLPHNYQSALKRLQNVEKKMNCNTEYAHCYRERVNHLFENNYARQVDDQEKADRIWYLPHFGVQNPKKKKLRLVFDAAAKFHGYCLNDFLIQGPDLLQSLLGIMLRFRERPIGIAADIRDMFLRVKIRPEDQHALRFLWRDESDPTIIKKYAMTSLIFGANCSPFIAQYIKNRNAERFQNSMPEAVNAITTSHYMDDYVDSLNNVASAQKIIQDVSHIHKEGGFEIRGWVSNSADALKNLPKHCLKERPEKVRMEDHAERTLGLLWYPTSDTFGFDLSLSRIPKEVLSLDRCPTKREILSLIMSIFDVYGLLAPFTVKAKILLREVWKTSTQWNQQIPKELNPDFQEWVKQLQTINAIRIPRWHFRKNTINPCAERDANINNTHSTLCENETVLELHVLCDAAPTAFCAVSFWRQLSKDGKCLSVSFIASKCRVAPIKPVSVPRMELQAALLGCRLADTILKEGKLKCHKKYFWTDSTTVLHWIRNDNRNYKIYVANRLGEIDTLSSKSEWHYIPTKMNIADVATKKNNYVLSNDCEWFCGPAFLHQSLQQLPKEPETEKINLELKEEHTVYNVTCKNNLPVPEISRFSSWLRLLRSTAAVLLFIEKLRKRKQSEINSELMNRAEALLVRIAQGQSFSIEINLLKSNRPLEKHNRLRKLTPYLDKQGILRVGGRIGAANNVDPNVKEPIILHGGHHLSRLIVRFYHIQAAHGNNEMVVNELRQSYWILKLRPTVRAVASKCLVCRMKRALPNPPRMGNLPEARLAHHQRPFTHCGVDLFGPLDVTVGRRREKRYGVLFTCLTVRAIHLELVTNLTADSFIMALRRMTARRGWPYQLYSDNGTNLRGAEAELQRSLLELRDSKVKSELAIRRLNWSFISPVSPHMGGAWERLIKSVKTSLKVILKERAPREEVLFTLMLEVENMVNSRPLSHVSVDCRTQEALTPNHFLIGGSSNMPIPGVFTDGDLYMRRQWRISQKLADMFWSRWVKEVLPAMLPRQKWTTETVPLSKGDLVLVVDPNSPRGMWSKGIIERTYPGKDGRVRVVDVKTKTGIRRRPATRIAVLPSGDECQ